MPIYFLFVKRTVKTNYLNPEQPINPTVFEVCSFFANGLYHARIFWFLADCRQLNIHLNQPFLLYAHLASPKIYLCFAYIFTAYSLPTTATGNFRFKSPNPKS